MITLKRICGNTIRNNEECNFNSEFSNIVLIKINLYKSYYVFPLLVLVFSLINILTFEQVVILLFSIRQSGFIADQRCFVSINTQCPALTRWFHHQMICVGFISHDFIILLSVLIYVQFHPDNVKTFLFHHMSTCFGFIINQCMKIFCFLSTQFSS